MARAAGLARQRSISHGPVQTHDRTRGQCIGRHTCVAAEVFGAVGADTACQVAARRRNDVDLSASWQFETSQGLSPAAAAAARLGNCREWPISPPAELGPRNAAWLPAGCPPQPGTPLSLARGPPRPVTFPPPRAWRRSGVARAAMIVKIEMRTETFAASDCRWRRWRCSHR